jgi:hypothetical protein
MRLLVATLAVGLLAGGAGAAEPLEAPGASLELQVKVDRYQEDELLASSPQTLRLIADGGHARVISGVEMPVWTMANDTLTTAFKDFGDSVSCKARSVARGRFELPCEVERYAPIGAGAGWSTSGPPATSFPLGDKPEMSMFGAHTTLVLGDGETARWTTATDPVTGHTVKVEGTLKVLAPAQGSAASAEAPNLVDLSVEFDRHLGGTRTSHATYALRLPDNGSGGEVRAGVQAPVRNPGGGQTTTFKNQGTVVQCQPQTLGDGRYRLPCFLQQNGPYAGKEDWGDLGAAETAFSLGGSPVVHKLGVMTELLVLDGETVVWPLGTDPVTGEEVNVKLTLKAVE